MYITKFSPEWKLWIWTNVVNGFNKESIFNILLNHGFSYELVKNELDIEPVNPMIWRRQYTQTELQKTPEVTLVPLNRTLCDNPNAYLIESTSLEIYRVPEFLTYAECDSVIEMNQEYLDIIEKRINVLTGIESGEQDIIEVHKHNDEDVYSTISGTWTVIIFLNSIIEGGEIEFPKVEMKFKSIKGEAIVVNNNYPNGLQNPNSIYHHLLSDGEEKITIIKTYSPKEKVIQEIILDNTDDFVEVK